MKIMMMTAVIVAVMGVACSGAETAVKTNAASSGFTSIKGKCTFGNKESTWSAKLTAKGDGTYDAVFTSNWDGQPGTFAGTIKTDAKTEISGSGKATGGRANGSFEFSGKYGADGLAKCNYKEVAGGRGRSGTLTIEKPE